MNPYIAWLNAKLTLLYDWSAEWFPKFTLIVSGKLENKKKKTMGKGDQVITQNCLTTWLSCVLMLCVSTSQHYLAYYKSAELFATLTSIVKTHTGYAWYCVTRWAKPRHIEHFMKIEIRLEISMLMLCSRIKWKQSVTYYASYNYFCITHAINHKYYSKPCYYIYEPLLLLK